MVTLSPETEGVVQIVIAVVLLAIAVIVYLTSRRHEVTSRVGAVIAAVMLIVAIVIAWIGLTQLDPYVSISNLHGNMAAWSTTMK